MCLVHLGGRPEIRLSRRACRRSAAGQPQRRGARLAGRPGQGRGARGPQLRARVRSPCGATRPPCPSGPSGGRRRRPRGQCACRGRGAARSCQRLPALGQWQRGRPCKARPPGAPPGPAAGAAASRNGGAAGAAAGGRPT
eukprot:6673606-Alexandrium_andersonii.AAC.1